MHSPHHIAAMVSQTEAYRRVAATVNVPRFASPRATLPDVDEFARELLESAEFRALQLGSWLMTPEGDLFETVAAQLISPAFVPQFRLVVRALELAAQQQHERKKRRVALGVGGAVVAFSLWSLWRSA